MKDGMYLSATTEFCPQGKSENLQCWSHRAKAVDERLHIGHWEGDTILHGHKNSGAVTLVKKFTSYFLLLAVCLSKLKADLVHHP